MLRHLHIRNFAIVDNLEIHFEPGMSVLSGETGAGKSILLDALGLTLGDRADSSVLRHGTERAEISAEFDVSELPGVCAWLEEHELASNGECLLRRTISNDGRSRGFINNQPTPIQSLKELGEQLVDIHGQHAHQSLLKRDIQRRLLDAYAGQLDLARTVANQYRKWQQLQQEYDTLSKAAAERDSRLELLRFQVDELEALKPAPGELVGLDQEYSRLSNANRLLEGAQTAVNLLNADEGQSAISVLEQSLRLLHELQAIDTTLNNPVQLLEGAAIQLKEAVSELRHYADALELDPERLAQLEQRITDLHNLGRKHRVAPDELPELLQQLQLELDELNASDSRLQGMQAEIEESRTAYDKLAQQLSEGRHKAAIKLAEAVTANMQELGMGGGRFDICLNPLEKGPSASGLENIELKVSANPGQPLQPLNKVASGGELSRISLAIQVITVSQEGIHTLIFDEVDVGIGGGVAEMVGKQLRQLGGNRQVLCVTHQPQVASQGHHHFRISKQSDGKETRTLVQPIDGEMRVQEIARMSGGVNITEQTLEHARQLISLAQE